MKKLIPFFLIFFTGFVFHGFSQSGINTSRSNIKNGVAAPQDKATCKGKLVFTESGCELVMTNQVTSAREAGSGMATGRRQYQPLTIVKRYDKASPVLAKSSGGSGKVSVQDLSVTVTVKGSPKRLQVTNNEFLMPEDCDDQDCDLVVSWSWGQTNSGSMGNHKLSAGLVMKEGSCVAIKQKGTGADKD